MFNHLKKLKAEDTAEYDIYQIAGDAKLIVRPTVGNTEYRNASLRFASKNKALFKGAVSSKAVDAHRASDRGLFAKHVVVGWKNIFDDGGDPVEFSPSNCEEFLTMLPDDIFDEIRDFAGNISNFRDELDTEETAGN